MTPGARAMVSDSRMLTRAGASVCLSADSGGRRNVLWRAACSLVVERSACGRRWAFRGIGTDPAAMSAMNTDLIAAFRAADGRLDGPFDAVPLMLLTDAAPSPPGVGLLDERDQLWRGAAVLLLDLLGIVGLHLIQRVPQTLVTAVEGLQQSHPLRG